MMNKFWKGCLITFGVLFLIIGGFAGFIYYQMSHSRENNERDNIECAEKKIITDQPEIIISDSLFAINVTYVKLFVIQNNSAIDSATVKNLAADRIEINLPFKKIDTKNKIEVRTDKKIFVIDSMQYFNDAHWGMFGYLGENCQLQYRINKN